MPDDIHNTAIVGPNAVIGKGVKIGPYSIIGDSVKLGDNIVIGPHVVLDGDTTIGNNCHIHSFASIGAKSQDLKDIEGGGKLIIGSGNTFREFVTINCGTMEGGGLTTLGDNNFLMAYTHVAHDCQLGNNIVMGNVATLAGHVIVEDYVILGGLVAVHQFVRIGRHAFIGGGSLIPMDIAPFVKVAGQESRGKLIGLNSIGLKRRGIELESINALKKAYKIIWRSKKMLEDALNEVDEELGGVEEVKHLVNFIRSSERGLTR